MDLIEGILPGSGQALAQGTRTFFFDLLKHPIRFFAQSPGFLESRLLSLTTTLQCALGGDQRYYRSIMLRVFHHQDHRKEGLGIIVSGRAQPWVGIGWPGFPVA